MEIDKRKIVRRYLDFLLEFEEYVHAKNGMDNDTARRKLENAGEKLSQVIEFAIKYHLRGVADSNFVLPRVIKSYYYDFDAIPASARSEYSNTLGGETPDVDFTYLAQNRDEVSNNPKHKGIEIIERDVLQYAIQVRRFLQHYVDSSYHWYTTKEFIDTPHSDINNFYETCNRFEDEDCQYILILPKLNEDMNGLRSFANVDWSLVINFDRDSDKDGGFSKCVYDNRYSQIIKTNDNYDKVNLSLMSKTPICYYSNGYASLPAAPSPKMWNKNYFSHLNSFLEALHNVAPTQKVVVVSLLDDEDYIKYMIDIFDRYFDNCEFLSIDLKRTINKAVIERYGAKYLNITLNEMDQCFSLYLSPSEVLSTTFYRLPHLDKKDDKGESGIDELSLITLLQYFDVLYIGAEKDCMAADKLAFNLGDRPLQWSDIVNRFDARISKFDRMYLKKIRTHIEKRDREIQITHEPGYGGTTIARQLAWELHEEYPVLILNKYVPECSTLIEDLYKRLKLPIVVFVEVPQVIKTEGRRKLMRSFNPTTPVTLIYVARKSFAFTDKIPTLVVEHWGADAGLLVNHFGEDLSNFSGNERINRKLALESIIRDEAEPYEQTPFYAGLVTYEEQFIAIDGFIKHFATSINDLQALKTAIIDLCLFDIYAASSLPAVFFAPIFGQENMTGVFKLEENIDRSSGIVKSLLKKEIYEKTTYWRIKRSFFSSKLLRELIQGNESVLTDYCVQLIQDMAMLPDYELAEMYVKEIFIQSHDERDGEFASIISSLSESSNKLRIFKAIVEKFPTNPHFQSHLARFYSKELHNFDEAIKYADAAIELNDSDPLLYHIKGSIYKLKIEDMSDGYQKEMTDARRLVSQIIELSDISADCFAQTRDLTEDSMELDSYGYISHIHMRVESIDFISRVLDISKADLLSREPYMEWLDEIQYLLEELKRSTEEEDRYTVECSNKVLSLYEDYRKILQNLQNLADRDSSSRTIANREIAHVLLYCTRMGWKTHEEVAGRIYELMTTNIDLEPSEEKNYILWFRAARMQNIPLDMVLSKITAWNNMYSFVDLSFYTYTLHVAKAITEHNSFSAQKALEYLKICQSRAHGDVRIREWLSDGNGLNCIVRHSKGMDMSQLRYVTGTIDNFINEGSASIVIDDTELKVFFNPKKSHITRSDMNRRVKFYLGFSYDGLRADIDTLALI